MQLKRRSINWSQLDSITRRTPGSDLVSEAWGGVCGWGFVGGVRGGTCGSSKGWDLWVELMEGVVGGACECGLWVE